MKINKQAGAFVPYWSDYGGCRALLGSRALWIAFVFAAISYNAWFDGKWWDDVLLVIPCLIGFSLAGYAMLLAFTSQRFLAVVTTPRLENQREPKPSPYGATSAAFAHFIFIQFLAVCGALLFKSMAVPVPDWLAGMLKNEHVSVALFARFTHWLSFFGYWLFLYAIVCGVPATMRIFILTKWFGRVSQIEKKGESLR